MADPGERIRVWAPGRVNLIGDHTDYVGGLALPMAIDLGTTVVGRRRPGRLHLRSDDSDADVTFDIGRSADPATLEPAWGRYAAAVVAELTDPHGFDGRVSTSLPIGAGLSSSAALEVAVALAVGADLAPVDLAVACQRAESRASGVPCGVMDQLTAICGIDGHALLIDFRTLTFVPVPVPTDLDVVVIHSGQPRELAGSKYAERRAEVETAEREIGPLRDAHPDDLAAIRDPVARKRARHVLHENARVEAFAVALAAHDFRAAGSIAFQSHVSIRDDFESSTAVVDALVDRLMATPGVFGARLVGGGFGGCVVALTEPGILDEGWTVQASAGASVEVQ